MDIVERSENSQIRIDHNRYNREGITKTCWHPSVFKFIMNIQFSICVRSRCNGSVRVSYMRVYEDRRLFNDISLSNHTTLRTSFIL